MMKYKFDEVEHVHALDTEGKGEYRPLFGTTTLINEVFPPPLAWYGSGKALESLGFISSNKEKDAEKRKTLALTGQLECKRAAELTIEEYQKWLEDNYKAHDAYKKARGKIGTDKHSEIEKYINTCLDVGGSPIAVTSGDLWENIKPFVDWANKDVDRFLASEKYVYSKDLWVGGKLDFLFLHKNGMTILGDNKPSVYPKHFIQTAGYGLQLRENGLFTEEGNKIAPAFIVDGYCIFDYTAGKPKYRIDTERLESYFKLAVDLYTHREIIGTDKLE